MVLKLVPSGAKPRCVHVRVQEGLDDDVDCSGGLIIILIDSRERNSYHIVKFLTSKNVESDIICWPTETGCDFLIVNTKGSVAVQRKVAVSELISELDITMNETIPALKAFNDNPVLLIEDNTGINKEGYLYNRETGRETEMLATAYYGYLETIRKSGVEVVMTRDLNASLWWMLSVHNYLEKNHYPKHRKYFTEQEQAMGMLMCVPGIGEKRAEKALMQNSIRGMSGMKKVNGLTDKQSERLGNILRWRAE